MPIVFSTLTVYTALRCSGDAKSPMYITIVAAIINMILDPIFMFDTIPVIGVPGLGLGIFGVALATVISNTIAFGIGFYVLFGPKSNLKLSWRGLVKIDLSLVKEITVVGTPPAFAGMVRNLANLVILRFITVYGTAALAAWGILSRLFGFLFMPIEGLLNGGSAMIGQNIGNGKIGRANKTARTAAILGGLSMLILGSITLIFAPFIMRLFIDDPEVINIGVPALRMVCISLIPIGFYFGLSTIFIGSGYTLPLLISGIVGQWIFQIPFIYLATRVWKLSFIWVAISFIVYTVGEGAILIYYYYSKKWVSKLPTIKKERKAG